MRVLGSKRLLPIIVRKVKAGQGHQDKQCRGQRAHRHGHGVQGQQQLPLTVPAEGTYQAGQPAAKGPQPVGDSEGQINAEEHEAGIQQRKAGHDDREGRKIPVEAVRDGGQG